MQNFHFLVFDGFSNMVLASVMEPLRNVVMREVGSDVRLHVVTMDGSPARASSGLTVAPDGVFDPETGDFLFVVAGYQVGQCLRPEVFRALRRFVRRGGTVAAVDAAAWILAAAGLLDDHKATIHWQELDAFAEHFPKVKVSTQRFVHAGPFMTCGGASTALDMVLELIAQRFGAAAAFDASTMFNYDLERQQSLERGAARLEGKGAPEVMASLNLMAAHIEAPLTLAAIASKLKVSSRTLTRAFRRDLGLSPGQYYQILRLRRARDLTSETNLTIEQIALRCGFSSASSLCRAHQRRYGMSLRHQ